MFTIIESPIFTKLWPDYWTEEERAEFAVYLALNPEAGKLIVGSGGCRKIRWAKEGSGKSGGVRIIYTAQTSKGQLWLLTIYSKSARDTIPANVLRKIAEELENGNE
ncbi:MAG TPA: transcriptional regulator [Spongiibacteraceae bacterium]|nr:transcriptional regulator [Spongiibacteraceae bacterium]